MYYPNQFAMPAIKKPGFFKRMWRAIFGKKDIPMYNVNMAPALNNANMAYQNQFQATGSSNFQQSILHDIIAWHNQGALTVTDVVQVLIYLSNLSHIIKTASQDPNLANAPWRQVFLIRTPHWNGEANNAAKLIENILNKRDAMLSMAVVIPVTALDEVIKLTEDAFKLLRLDGDIGFEPDNRIVHFKTSDGSVQPYRVPEQLLIPINKPAAYIQQSQLSQLQPVTQPQPGQPGATGQLPNGQLPYGRTQ